MLEMSTINRSCEIKKEVKIYIDIFAVLLNAFVKKDQNFEFKNA